MKGKSEEIDRLFREGFREEEQYAPEIPEDRFDAYFTDQAPESGKPIFLRQYRISIAASILLAAMSLGWLFSGKLSEKTSENLLAVAEPQEGMLTEAHLPALQEKPVNKEKPAQKETIISKDKTKKSAKPGNRNRRKKFGATMFPGIFPTPLFEAQQKVASALEKPENLPVTTVEITPEQSLETPAFVQDNSIPESDGNEVVAVEFHPEKPLQKEEPIEVIQEPVKKKSLFSFIARARQLDLSAVPSVEEAKELLVSGIGRLVGLNHEEAENQSKENTESEL